MNDHQLASWLAETAGRLLLAIRDGPLRDAGLGIAGDQVANAFLVNALARLRPGDAILSEESADDPARLQAKRVWIVDPLDGTLEYSEGRPDWAVHVGLVEEGRPLAGAVAVPAEGRLFRTDGALAPAAARRRPVMLVSRTRAPEEAQALAQHLGAELRLMGSAGAKAMAVVAGQADIYYHAGGQREWDNCAPAAVALAAGLHASRADGSPLIYNRPDKMVPDLVIARPEIAAAAITFLAGWKPL